MANPQVTIDVLEGMSGNFDIINGAMIYRMATVTGLVSDGNGNYDPGGANTGQLYQRSLDAIQAVATVASACPGVTVPHYLKEYSMPEFPAPDMARMKLTYKGFPAIQIEFNSSLAQVETNVDNQGNALTTVYTYPTDYLLNPSFKGQTVPQGGFVSQPVSEPSFTVRFTTSGITGVTSMALLVGKVNQNPYPVGVISGAPRSWMVTGFRALSEDGGITYNAALSMQWRETLWDTRIVFIDPSTGKPPPDAIQGIGYKTPQIAVAAVLPILI